MCCRTTPHSVQAERTPKGVKALVPGTRSVTWPLPTSEITLEEAIGQMQSSMRSNKGHRAERGAKCNAEPPRPELDSEASFWVASSQNFCECRGIGAMQGTQLRLGGFEFDGKVPKYLKLSCVLKPRAQQAQCKLCIP